MSMLDNALILSDAQALTATADSSSHIDKGAAGALGRRMFLIVRVASGADFTAAGAATLQISLQDSADDSSFADILDSPVIAKAAMVQGAQLFRVSLPANLRRYQKLVYTVATGPFTAGALNAYIVPEDKIDAQ